MMLLTMIFLMGAKDVTALIDAACTSGGVYTTQFGSPKLLKQGPAEERP